MKTGAAIILFLAFAAQTFSKAFVVVDYYTRTDAYAVNCENKDKPVLKCNGKCQMAKKMGEEEKKDQQDPERKLENKVQLLSSKSFFTCVSSQPSPVLTTTTNQFPSAFLPSIFPRDIFHPPIA